MKTERSSPEAGLHSRITTTASSWLAMALLALLCAVSSGCGMVHATKDADKVVERHFQAMATNGFSAAMAEYAPGFFEKTPKEDWMKALHKLNTKLGAFQSYKTTSWNINENAGTFGAGITVQMQCQVTYSKHTATENFLLFKGIGDSDFKILGHHIESAALLTE